MDIIISAPAGTGKTTVAVAMIKQILGAKRFGDIVNEVLVINHNTFDTASRLAQHLRDYKPNAILFDGCITTPDDMLLYVEGVKRYREQTGRPHTLAVYVEQGAAVILTNGHKDSKAINEFKRKPYETNSQLKDRTLEIIEDLQAQIVALYGAEADRRINAKVFVLSEQNEDARLSVLPHQVRPAMHEFLLDLLREYEK